MNLQKGPPLLYINKSQLVNNALSDIAEYVAVSKYSNINT